MKLQKLTSNIEAKRRRYDDACAAAHAMDILGERWAVPVMRELMFGPLRFGELRDAIPAISANILTQRLIGLEAAGVVRRYRLPSPASTPVYELTNWGYEAAPIFQVMGRWGARSPAHDPQRPFSPASLLLSFRTMMNAERAQGLTARIGFRLGQSDFLLELDDGVAVPARGSIADADLIFVGAPAAIAAAAYGGVPLRELEKQGAVTIEGNRELAERFVTLFPLPSKASSA